METKRVMDEKGGFTETGTQQQNSIEINRTAKGDYSWSLKVYCDDPLQAAEIAAKYKVVIEKVIGMPEAK